jgi:hypothetical protein
MKLKLDLHPIFNDTRKIEEALEGIIEEAVTKRATEVEIIPGKGSGALKKSVLRFLERPDIKSQYHRVEKDGDNWGRLFVHFRHDRSDSTPKAKASTQWITASCACCAGEIKAPEPEEETELSLECPGCGSPNRITLRRDRKGVIHTRTELNYPEA